MPVKFTSSKPEIIHQIVFGGALVGLALMVTKRMMSGGVSNFQTIAALLVAVALVLLLDKYYWILCPSFSALGITIPGLPFDSMEVGFLSLIAMRFIRSATRRDPIAKLNRNALAAIPIFAWILIIWILNPTGLAILSSESIGARFYFKIVIGFLTLFSLATMKFGEKECKILFYTLLVSSIISAVFAAVAPNLLNESANDFSDSTTHYELLRMGTIFLILYARYGLSTILSSLPLFLIMLTCAGAMVVSGKRQMTACVALYPIFYSIITKRDVMKTIAFGLAGSVMLLFVVAGDNVLYELPRSARRSLAVVIPSYTEKYDLGGASDSFRDMMRDSAKSIIREHPFIGRKGFAFSLGETLWVTSNDKNGTNIARHVISGNWHSTWFAFAADFGIPAAILWALFSIWALKTSIQNTRKTPFYSFASACCMIYTIRIMQSITFSYTSGHSSLTPMGIWYYYGILLAIWNGSLLSNSEQNLSISTPLRNTRPPRTQPPTASLPPL